MIYWVRSNLKVNIKKSNVRRIWLKMIGIFRFSAVDNGA